MTGKIDLSANNISTPYEVKGAELTFFLLYTVQEDDFFHKSFKLPIATRNSKNENTIFQIQLLYQTYPLSFMHRHSITGL